MSTGNGPKKASRSSSEWRAREKGARAFYPGKTAGILFTRGELRQGPVPPSRQPMRRRVAKRLDELGPARRPRPRVERAKLPARSGRLLAGIPRICSSEGVASRTGTATSPEQVRGPCGLGYRRWALCPRAKPRRRPGGGPAAARPGAGGDPAHTRPGPLAGAAPARVWPSRGPVAEKPRFCYVPGMEIDPFASVKARRAELIPDPRPES